MTVSVDGADYSPTTALVDEKVKELLDDDSIDEFFHSVIYSRPQSVPPLVDVAVKRLSHSEEQELISRLTKRSPSPKIPDTSSLAGPRRFMSKKSIELTQGLESIEKRALKLAKAHQRRIEQLVQEKENEEAQQMYGTPRINPVSRRLAEKSSFTDRQLALQERRRILEQEARREELQECVFRPTINPRSAAAAARRNAAGNNVNVIDRLTRDAELRQSRRLQLARDKEQEESVIQPKITPVAHQIFSSRTPSVFERLYPNSMPPPPTSPKSTKQNVSAIPYSQFMQSTTNRFEDHSVNMSRIPQISKQHIDFPDTSMSSPPLRPLKQLDLSSIFALTRGGRN